MAVVIRETPLAAAIGDVSRNPRPFIIYNRERHPEAPPPVPPLYLEALPMDFTGDLLVAATMLGELRTANIAVGRDRERFVAGEPVMVAVQKVHEIPERAWGGQAVAGLEKRARDGMYVTVALATERLRACVDLREHRKLAPSVRRGEILTRLKPLLPGLSPINLFREGQSLLAEWFPGRTAHQVLKSAYASIADRRGRVNLASIEDEQIALVATACAIYDKTLVFVGAQHEASALIRELIESPEFKNATVAEKYDLQAAVLRERGPAPHQELAHDMQGGPTPRELVLAAAATGFNPAVVFLNAVFLKSALDCAVRLGRAERGHYVMLEPADIERLAACMALADGEERDDLDPIAAAGLCLWQLALKVRPHFGWEEFFAIAEANPGPMAVTKSLR